MYNNVEEFNWCNESDIIEEKKDIKVIDKAFAEIRKMPKNEN